MHSGLRRICELSGRISLADKDGKITRYVWDYAREEPTLVQNMLPGSERFKASELARIQQLKQRTEESHDG